MCECLLEIHEYKLQNYTNYINYIYYNIEIHSWQYHDTNCYSWVLLSHEAILIKAILIEALSNYRVKGAMNGNWFPKRSLLYQKYSSCELWHTKDLRAPHTTHLLTFWVLHDVYGAEWDWCHPSFWLKNEREKCV